MNIQQLRPDQHDALKVQVESRFQYWERLLDRLDNRRFPRKGEFFQLVLQAHQAASKVWEYIEFHKPQSGPEDGGLPF